MSKVNEVISIKYAGLCQKVGDLINQREKIDLQLKEIKTEIYGLNEILPSMLDIEKNINAAHAIELDKIAAETKLKSQNE